MSFWHEVEKIKARATQALELAKPVIATAQADLKPLENVPGVVGKGAMVAESGVDVLSLLVAEFEALIAAVPNADSVPPPPSGTPTAA